MLITFRSENHRSLRDLSEMSMVVPSWVETDDLTIAIGGQTGIRIGTVAAIYGANASGKTNMLSGLWDMTAMVTNSHQSWKPTSKIPHKPFFTEPHSKSPTMFEADVYVDGERYQYGFRFDRERILEEWLYSFPKGRPRLLFDRDVTREAEFRFGRGLKGRAAIIADLTRENSLFLSAAAANNNQQLMPLANWFDRHVQRTTPADKEGRVLFTVSQIRKDENKARILDLLRFADLGISDVRVVENDIDEDFKARVSDVMKALNPQTDLTNFNWKAVGRHAQLSHQVSDGSPVYLELDEESEGTRAWLSLLGPLLVALDDGDLLLVDELDASLHPRLSSEVVKIFHDPLLNPNGAQIIFNTHDPSLMGTLLGEEPLRRDEVWLTEKAKDGATRLYPLTDFRPRKAENLERGYLQGRYGGIPFLDRELAISALAQNRDREDASA